uniref:lipopolysaccharide heptosyltransferase II n=1 Tax=Neisseria meningitidis TaxID=487 RepID=Q51110_NEIME|nr:LPS-heptosyl-2-transferase [Neisseria meningitidis]prf//2211390A heptosyl-2-transferase [Neisseria meningitidis]
MTQPLFRRLKELHPGCTIDVFAPKWSMAVFERRPEVNEILENSFGHGALELKRRWRVGRELGRRGYDQVIVLPGSLKSAIIALATGSVKGRVMSVKARYFLLNDIRRLDKERLPLMVDRYTALAHPSQEDFDGHSGFPEFSIDERRREISVETFGLDIGKPVLAFCPGAEFGPAKRWPTRHFAELGKHYLAAGWQVWLFGSQKDDEIAEEINRLSDGMCVNLCGKTDLSQAMDLLSLADTVVCNDSGLMHLAAALGRKVVAVYGSSSPTHTPPLSDRAKIVSLHLECSPCFKRECRWGIPTASTGCIPRRLCRRLKRRYDGFCFRVYAV